MYQIEEGEEFSNEDEIEREGQIEIQHAEVKQTVEDREKRKEKRREQSVTAKALLLENKQKNLIHPEFKNQKKNQEEAQEKIVKEVKLVTSEVKEKKRQKSSEIETIEKK